MKAFIVFLIIGILSYIVGIFYPWWSIAVVAFVVTLIVPQKPFIAFLTAFLAVFVFWFSMAFFIDLSNDHIMGNRIAVLFLHTPSSIIMAVISGVIGGLVAGLAAMTASFLRVKRPAPGGVTYKNI